MPMTCQNGLVNKWFAGLALAVLLIVTGGSWALEAVVRDHLGSPTIFVNGQPIVPMIFMGRNIGTGWEDKFRSQAQKAAAVGIHLHMIDIPCGGMFDWRVGTTAPNYSEPDRMMRFIIETDPQALVLVRIRTEAPHWSWLVQHPSERIQFHNGQIMNDRNSMASELWRRDLVPNLRAYVRHLEDNFGEHIIGYHQTGGNTDEWFYWGVWEGLYCGYEAPYRTGFINWLRQKYPTVEALRAAWAMPDITFETVQVPTVDQRTSTTLGSFRDPRTQRYTIDFYHYQQEVIVEALEIMAKAVKDETQNKKLVAQFYGYTFALSGVPRGAQVSGHLALGRLLKCPYVDIVGAPVNYGDRYVGGAGTFMSPVDSVREAGKLWMSEDDTRTYLVGGSSMGVNDGANTLERTRWVHERNFAQMLPRRLGCWYIDLPQKNWLDSQEIWNYLGELKAIYEQELNRPQRWKPEVALIVDEKTPLYLEDTNSLTGQLYNGMASTMHRCGAPIRMNLLSDVLEGRLTLPKVTVFTGCMNLTPAEREILRNAVRGKTAIWMAGSGYLDGTQGAAENIEALTGIKVRQDTYNMPLATMLEEGHPYAAGLTIEFLRVMGGGFVQPRWYVEPTSDTTIVARYLYEDKKPAVAVRADGVGGRSIYAGTGNLKPEFLRNVLREAGVHMFLDSNDIVLTDGSYLCITASDKGVKRIRVPVNTTISRLKDGQVLAQTNHEVAETFAQGEVRHYRLQGSNSVSPAIASHYMD